MFAVRPRLAAALGLGLAIGVGSAVLDPNLRASTCAIAGWDTFCAAFLVLTLHAFAGQGPAEIRVHTAQQDQGRAVVLVLILTACVASLAAAALELSLARHADGPLKAARVGAAFGTVTASWLVMQFVFAMHYAHEYYAADPQTRGDVGGLAFPGGAPPDYWDFLHFSMVIGVAAQTADIAFTSQAMRRLGTAHCLIAFAFNTLIVALTINLLAGLFGDG